MVTAWAHLPNAKHIDRILADVKANPDKWGAAYDAAWDTASNAAYDAAHDAASNAVRNAARNTARDAISDDAWYDAWYAASNIAWYAARSAILALIAYDDCAYLLNEKPEDVKMMALLGNQKAILLYPACVALYKEKETEVI